MRNVAVVDGVHLRLDEDQQVDPVAVGRLLTESCHQAWAGLDLPGETALADLDLWLAAGPTADVAGTFVVPTAQPAAVETNLVAPAWRFGAPAILLAGTFGYRSALRWSNGRFDLGARANGPDAAGLAGQLVAQMRDKRHTRLVLTFTVATTG